jgi:hypothetical protein
MLKALFVVLAHAAIIECCRLGGLNNRCRSLVVLETGKPQYQGTGMVRSGEDPLRGLGTAIFSDCFTWQRAEKEKAAPWDFFS